MLQKGPSISHVSSRNHSDDSNSGDSDYEDNIPLQIFKKDLIQCLGRMRIKKRLHKLEVIKCETQRKLWDLDDYEAFAPKTEHKVVRKPEYRSLGMQPFSPIDNKKQICEVLVTSQFNKDKSTIKVDEGQKMTEVARTSTPKNKVYQDCIIELSPIQNSIQSKTVQLAFSEHGNVYLHCDDSNSDESDDEDNIPLKVVQEGLNPMSVVSPICSRTRNIQCHNSMSQYEIEQKV